MNKPCLENDFYSFQSLFYWWKCRECQSQWWRISWILKFPCYYNLCEHKSETENVKNVIMNAQKWEKLKKHMWRNHLNNLHWNIQMKWMWLRIQRNKKTKESFMKKPCLKRISTAPKVYYIDNNVGNVKKN